MKRKHEHDALATCNTVSLLQLESQTNSRSNKCVHLLHAFWMQTQDGHTFAASRTRQPMRLANFCKFSSTKASTASWQLANLLDSSSLNLPLLPCYNPALDRKLGWALILAVSSDLSRARSSIGQQTLSSRGMMERTIQHERAIQLLPSICLLTSFAQLCKQKPPTTSHCRVGSSGKPLSSKCGV